MAATLSLAATTASRFHELDLPRRNYSRERRREKKKEKKKRRNLETRTQLKKKEKKKRKEGRTPETEPTRRKEKKKKVDWSKGVGPYVCLITKMSLSYELWKMKTSKMCFQFP